MENGNPIEQVKGFAEKKLHALRENPDAKGSWKSTWRRSRTLGDLI